MRLQNFNKEWPPLAGEDGKVIRAFNTAVVGADIVVPISGGVQYGLSRKWGNRWGR